MTYPFPRLLPLGYGELRRLAMRRLKNLDHKIMPTFQTMRSGGPSPAEIIGLTTLLGALALATALLGTLTPPLFFFFYAFVDLVIFLQYYRRLIGLSEMVSGRFARWIVGMTPVGC
jgi:hypothetical protein